MKSFAVALLVSLAVSCAREETKPVPREFELGARRVQVVVPEGWEALDQGKVKRFRRGESQIVLQNLGLPQGSPPTFDALIEWGLAEVGHNPQRSEEKSRRLTKVDEYEAMDIQTWSRLDHTNPQRIFFVHVEDELIALKTDTMAFEDTLKAFDLIRDSLHFVSVRK